MDKQKIDDQLTERFTNRAFQTYDSRERAIDNRMVSKSDKCNPGRDKPSQFQQLAGYENLNTNTFYLEPEKKNTYHNYPVLTDDGEFCSMNHQIFRNNTRRNVGIAQEETTDEVAKKHMEELVQDDKPIFLQYNECRLLNGKKN